MRMLKRSPGQSVLEYTLLITLAALALAGAFGYIRSALAHRMKTGADGIGHGMLY